VDHQQQKLLEENILKGRTVEFRPAASPKAAGIRSSGSFPADFNSPAVNHHGSFQVSERDAAQ
jgi:hypothetical protein